MTINILGTEYTIKNSTEKNDKNLKTMAGYMDATTKEIVIKTDYEDEPNKVNNLNYHIQEVIRHEIIHAFFYESGLWDSSDYGMNETLVDWIAIQIPKIVKVFDEYKSKINNNEVVNK